MKKPQFIFSCKKCLHEVYVDKQRVDKLLEFDCPKCWEKWYELWKLVWEWDFKNK